MSIDPSVPEALARLKQEVSSVQLATIGEDGRPHIGYTPFLMQEGLLFIFVSRLARHTRDLLRHGEVCAMIIADEQSSSQVFARTRVSYQCRAVAIDPQDSAHGQCLDALQQRHGKMVGLLRTLPDFVLFRLTPYEGQFVMGFGQAYRLSGEQLDRFELARSA